MKARRAEAGCLFRLTSAVILLGCCLSACAVNPATGKSDFVLLSERDEIKLGRESHAPIVKQFGGEYPDPALQAYVRRVGARLAAHSHRDDLIYRFTVLDSSEVNAFALPGGYIYITRGCSPFSTPRPRWRRCSATRSDT
jgi:predicted Zn-dependent protease